MLRRTDGVAASPIEHVVEIATPGSRVV
jgi:hypothetical protein